MRNELFTFGKIQLRYHEPFKDTERRFEIALLKYFLNKFSGDKDVMEVGAVSNYHFPISHKIYDAGEGGSVINQLAENLNYEGKKVVSISTIEHIGKGDYGLPIHPYRCISVLNMMMEAELYLITWPIGYNTLLDYYARNIITGVNHQNVITAKRLDVDNNWEICNPPYFDFEYGKPFPVGNGLIIITNLPELM